MKTGDVVRIMTFGLQTAVRGPCYAYVYDDGSGSNANLVILTGGYRVTSKWCEVGHTFCLPHRGPRDQANWRVLPEDDVPDEVYVLLAKRALLSEGEN